MSVVLENTPLKIHGTQVAYLYGLKFMTFFHIFRISENVT